jgi:uncharacterized protein (TIGR03032 family)
MSLARFSPKAAAVLQELGISIVLSSYTAGRVFLFGCQQATPVQSGIRLKKAAGIAKSGALLAIAGDNGVLVFRHEPRLAHPQNSELYRSIFYPIREFKTHHLNLHDLAFTQQGLVGVCTGQNCLGQIDNADYLQFKHIWQPNFISNVSFTDCCHLNGMAVDEQGDIRYVTAFSQSNHNESWRETAGIETGVVIDVKTQLSVATGLSMPHSPRWYQGRLYYLNSATEQLYCFDPTTGQNQLLVQAAGFLRGMDFYQHYAFIGVSRLRKTSSFGFLPIANRVIKPGFIIVDLLKQEIIGDVLLPDGVDEVFDLKVLTEPGPANLYDPDRPDALQACIADQGAAWFKH